MRRTLVIAAAVTLALAIAPAAQGASALVVTGAGFGHGVGLSQYGALGYAQAGWTAPRILAHYYTGTALGRLGGAPVVRVLLQDGRGAYDVRGVARAGGRTIDPARTYRVSAGGRGLLLREAGSGEALLTSEAPMVLEAPGGGALTLGGAAYRGALEIRPGTRGLMAVNAVGLEDYVAGVISAEVPASWPAETLRAQAIAARTYAVTTNAGGAGGAFTQYADTRSQMYRGVAAETPSTTAAVRATAGQVVTYDGKPVTTFFFSSSGGRTENVENSFVGSAPKPWLKGVADAGDRTSPYHRWRVTRMTLGRATVLLGASVKGRLRFIRVVQRGVSPRIVRAEVVGTAGTTTVTGPQLRRLFGLRDTWATFRSFTTTVARAPAVSAPSLGARLPGALKADAVGDAGALVIRGSVAPAARGSWATVQRLAGGRWVRAVDVRLGSGGAFSERLPGPGRYRVRFGGVVGPVVVG